MKHNYILWVPESSRYPPNLNSVREGGGYKAEGLKYYSDESRERHKLEPGDIVVANTEQGFDHLLIGYPAIVPEGLGDKVLFSQDLFRLDPLPGSELAKNFIYLALTDERMHYQVAGYSNGTTINHLDSEGLRRPLVVVPPKELMERFEDIVAPMLSERSALTERFISLQDLRRELVGRVARQS